MADVEASSCIEHCHIHEQTNLNLSDHLPLSVTLSCQIPTQFVQDPDWFRIDWSKAEKSGAYKKEVKERLNPFIGRSRSNIDHIDDELKHVAWLISDAAGRKTLLHFTTRKTRRFNDMALTQLCAKSKEAWRTWQDNGRPLSGPLYDTKNEARKLVKQRIKFCAAMKERKLIQTREKLFRSSAPYRFKIPQKRGKSKCTCLRVDGNLISDPLQLMKAWTQHFRNLTLVVIQLY